MADLITAAEARERTNKAIQARLEQEIEEITSKIHKAYNECLSEITYGKYINDEAVKCLKDKGYTVIRTKGSQLDSDGVTKISW